ncbi:MAG TPA: hypothetical protein PKY86_06905 [Niabella sp.]|nr:hypothetical protein [Niabella sp.]HQW14895.1 hypothetical protein [Niabella sp.]HQX18480.1 hypothetical protein [Niabella sp.]HQX41478.1 hypothetical protein [Niabella sp.]HRB06007.1 hypothetical protein [Niabella sp.]
MEDSPRNLLDTNSLSETENAILQLCKWIRLVSVAGFSIGAIVVVAMLMNGSDILHQFAETLPYKIKGLYGILVAVFFVVFFITALLLYSLHRAVTFIIQGLQQKNNVMIGQGFGFLKKFFITLAVIGVVQFLFNLSNLF